MRDIGQIAQHRHRVCAIGILPRQFRQSPRRIALHDQIKQIQHPATVGKTQHRAHLIGRGLSGPVRDRLIQQAGGITRRAFGRACDQRQSPIRNLRTLGGGDLAQKRNLHLWLDAFQIKALTA